MPALSVIMPVYNTNPKYVVTAIESVLKQSVQDLELIVVDDCSDKIDMKQIVAGFADQRIRLIRNPQNEGLGSSRNVGMQAASGEYVGFIDSDDFIDSRMYEKLLETAHGNNADIVGCDISLCDENGHFYDTNTTGSKRMCRTREEKIRSLKNGAVWNKIFKRDLVQKIRFPEKVLFEDNLFTIKACEFSKLLVQLPEKYYHYRQVSSSLTHDREKSKQRSAGKKIAVLDIFCFMQERHYSITEQICVLTFCRKIFGLTSQDTDVYAAFKQVCKNRRLICALFKDQTLGYKLSNVIKAYLFFPIYIRKIYIQNKRILKYMD